jgi:3-methyladenine DNA glycosylase AlkC
VLQALAKDKSVYVRRGVASNPSCPLALLEKLANKADVQENVADNPSCPPALFETLMEAYVREQRVSSAICIASRKESSSGDLRILARIWKYSFKQLGIRFGNENGIDSMLATQNDDQLVSTFKQETALLLINPEQSQLAQVIQGDTPQGILALSKSGGSAAAKSSLRAARLLGLFHVHASPDVLAKRSKSTDWVERLAVACNSSTPTNILAQLKNDPHQLVAEASRHGEEGKRDAGDRLSDALLRNADLEVEPLIEEIRCRIRKVTDPKQLRNLHSSCWQTSISESQLITEREAASHPNTSPALLEVLAKHKDLHARCNVAENPSCPSAVLFTLLNDNNKIVRKIAASNPKCRSKLDPSQVEKIVGSLVRQAKSKKYDVREEVASNPLSPPALLEILSNDAEELVGWTAVSNPSFPPARLDEFVKKDSKHLKMWKLAVAEHPGCPASLLDVVSGDNGLGAAAVAKHPNTSLKTLTRLAKDRRYYEELAQNPACPPPILEVLARDNDKWVLRHVAANPACPPAILNALVADKDEYIRASVAANPVCPAAICEVLVEDESDWVRSRMAYNPVCSTTVLDTLVMSGYPGLIWLAIHHDNATPEQLLKWAGDARLHPALRHACVRRPQFPASEKALVDEITRLTETPPQELRNVTDEEWILAFRALDLYPEDKKAVAKSAKAKDWLQRAAATFSPDIQPNQLKLLLDDSEEIVRQLAAERLSQREPAKS